MILLTIAIIFVVLYAGLFYYYLKGWHAADIVLQKTSDLKFISVVVAARNEEHNISFLLDALTSQTYPAQFFEIIVVDDFSTDDTAAIVKRSVLNNLQLI